MKEVSSLNSQAIAEYSNSIKAHPAQGDQTNGRSLTQLACCCTHAGNSDAVGVLFTKMSGFPHLPPESWRLRVDNLDKVIEDLFLAVDIFTNAKVGPTWPTFLLCVLQILDPRQQKQQGRSPLSSAEMLLLDKTRTQLRSALELADLGDQAAARRSLLKVLYLLVTVLSELRSG